MESTELGKAKARQDDFGRFDGSVAGNERTIRSRFGASVPEFKPQGWDSRGSHQDQGIMEFFVARFAEGRPSSEGILETNHHSAPRPFLLLGGALGKSGMRRHGAFKV